MENISKIVDDSCTSMYYSFNSTSANKTVEAMDSVTEISCIADDTENEQNLTLEADENNDAPEQLQTVKKLSFGVSPLKAIPKNILQAYKTLSSTPTKAQLLRSVEVTRGSGSVDVCDLGIAFLDAPQESINLVLAEDKENCPQQESQEIYSETSSEIVVSVIEKTQLEEPVVKKVGFSNLPVLKSSSNMNVRGTPKPAKTNAKCAPDLNTNRPSRIATKRSSLHSKAQPAPNNKEFGEDDIPKMINSMLKISSALPTKGRTSLLNPEKPFSLLGKATRMSILKTTLNSPARKAARKSINSVQASRPNTVRQSVGPTNKRTTMIPNMTSTSRRSVIPSASRKSVMPTTVTSPNKRIIPSNSRRSIVPGKQKIMSSLPTSRKSVAPKSTTSTIPTREELQSKQFKSKAAPSDLKEEFTCDVCNRKFRVHSLFEVHRKSHRAVAQSSKQTFATNDKQCRYCDKKFAIAKALTNHLLEKCTKIPPGDKKKLLFPSDQPQIDTTKQRGQISKNLTNFSSCDSLASNSTQSTVTHSENQDRSMHPPSVNKLKKKIAHSGVYCTPNKMISCHVCKLSFNNILAFAEHSLTHSNPAGDGAAPAADESTQTQVELKNDSTQTPENGVGSK